MNLQTITRMSAPGRGFLVDREGYKTHVYRDSGGEPTIAVGHLLLRSERRSGCVLIGGKWIPYLNGLSTDQIDALLSQDLDGPERALTRDIRVPLAQHQFDALCSFVFNIGVPAFEDVDPKTPGLQPCRVLRAINAGELGRVPDLMSEWVHDAGVVVPGLVNRREFEVALWKGEI